MKICVDINKEKGIMKPMHCVNNGPVPEFSYEHKGNFNTFKELCIPYIRNHDASLSEAYGSQHVVDVHCIFPNFDNDPELESSYDFQMTDEYNETIYKACSKVFYRLGSSIEHWSKKYGTLVPKDFNKWADICIHIIKHYTQGWANGYNYDMEYWEIWNEPDLDRDDAKNKRTWSGVKTEFFDFYEVVAKKLKKEFPHLKIGGPAIAGNLEWTADFLKEMKKREVPIDFFSWHIYTINTENVQYRAAEVKKLLLETGYGNAQSILNEWNYIKSWNDPRGNTKVIKGLKGASFSNAVMCASQYDENIDMLMYYDARVEKIWNGLYNSDTLLPIKGYYPFKMFSELYQLGRCIDFTSDSANIYGCAAKDENTVKLMLTNYTDECTEEQNDNVDICFNGSDLKGRKAEIYYLDDTHDFSLVKTEQITENDYKCRIELPLYSSCMIKIF